ncbi:hypothetical protein EC991_006197 [Linnemannia zychae]|nr:hypothetical protein EC991_006197 [Linnemannia zychae]
MNCKNAGDLPKVEETCTLTCTKQLQSDKCALDPCACTKAGDTCGSAFPDCNYEKDAQYTCSGNKALPVKKAACPADNVCLATATGSVCTPPDCVCKDDDSHCGSRYPANCNLKSETLYQCTLGALPVATRDCAPGICSANIVAGTAAFKAQAEGDVCIDQCACKEVNVPVGDIPTVKETCTLSCTVQLGPDICTLDPCACTKAGDVCGSSFDPTCGHDETSVYTCDGNKMLPKKKDSCPTATVCLETGSGPTCTPLDCFCKDSGSHCGSTFIPECNVQSNSLYKCTKGKLPGYVKDCTPGICSANVVAGLSVFRAMADDTCLNQCACKEANVPVCASTFDPVCNYGNKSLMACGNAGDVPTVKEACTISCTEQAGPDVCTFDPCACTEAGDACGSSLPPNCGYEKDSVYSCSAVKALPQKKSACPATNICLDIPSGPTCTPSNCVCQDNGSHCGSTFIETCNLQDNSLYKCTIGRSPSLVNDCGTGTCSANVAKETSEFRATPDDKCLDLCACKEANVPVCASAFNATCNYDPKALMNCGQAGDVPTIKEKCTLSCTNQLGTDKCTFDPCACTKSGSFCGSAFPSNCGYEANTLYTCEPIALPVVDKGCLPGICSTNTTATNAQPGATGLDICIGQCACKQAGVTVCASEFDPSCGYDSKALMECGSIADIPKFNEACTSGCDANADPDVCAINPCACTKAGDVCGSVFPDSCGYKNDTVYGCAANKTLPTPLHDCTTVGVCLSTPSGPTCTPPDCICKDDGDNCGSTFIDACNLQRNALYKCTTGGLPSLVKDCGTGTCSANVIKGTAAFRATANDICIDKCACKEAHIPVCSFDFDPICQYAEKTLMSCGEAGDVPEVAENCTIACSRLPGPDECVFDPCACTKVGDTCGIAFPVTCSYELHARYTCLANKAIPVKMESCLAGDVCLFSPAGSLCTPPDCVCMDNGSHCGSTFMPHCNLQSNTLYKCTIGKLPEVVKDCGTGTCSASVVAGTAAFRAMGDDKCLDLCACKEANVPVCASMFDESCGYGNKSLMDCGNAGEIPTVKEACTLSCTKKPGPDECTFDPCACTKAGDICGSTFPDACNYEKESQYTCSANKALPVKKLACPTANVCLATPTGLVCTPPECICKDELSHCGSKFAATCGLANDTLYKCTNGQLPTLVKDCAPGICSANVVAGTAAFSAMADDKCLDQCACKEGPVTVCSSTFDAVCNYGTKSLMNCVKAGDVPTVAESCTLSCTKQPGPDVCTFDPCACKKSGDTCGSSYPTNCTYEPTSIYACAANKTIPTKKSPCAASTVCLETTTAPVCTPPECICKESSNKCGSTFATVCGLKANTLYRCVPDALPTLVRDCGTGTCSANVVKGTSADFRAMTDDICIDQCACKEANVTVCGSAYPTSCLYNAKALMTCDRVGAVPTVQETCTLSCTVQAGPDVCALDPCACTTLGDVCGTIFPAKCNYKATTIYTCPALKAIPVKKQNCLGNAICFLQPTGHKCTLPECICKDDAMHCGSAFYGACNTISNSLYSCVNGALPTVSRDCSPGVCSGNIVSDAILESIDANRTIASLAHNNVLDASTEVIEPNTIPAQPRYKRISNFRATADEFCVDQCACKESESLICSTSFDPVCNYNATALMSCNEVGDMPVSMTVCSKGCKPTSLGAECNPDPCACLMAGDVCGKSLPANCAYNPDDVYSCVGAGASPEMKHGCTGGATCSDTAAGPTCTSTDCVCKDDGLHCGSQFPSSCAFAENSLYRCVVGAAPTVSEDCGDGKCSANIKLSGKMEFKAAGDDTCVNKCACQEANVPVCAASFPAACNYDNKTLMSCGNQGDVPTVSETCTSYCDVIASAPDVCAFDPCACRRVGDTCGKSFPENCGYLANRVYTCATNRTLPVLKTICSQSEICQSVPGGSDVCVANMVCGCVGTGTVCTDRFPPDCGKPANSVIDCPAGTVTACPDGCAGGECKAAGCQCMDDSVKCGSSFAPSCNLISSALYTCVSGQRPVLKTDCGNNACVRSTPNAMCQDPCKCRGTNAVCGSSFPTSCGIASNTLFSCAAIGATPTQVSVCAAGCYASSPDASCKKECATAVVAATAEIDKMVAAMTALVSSSNISAVVYPPLTGILKEVKANLTTVKDDINALATIAATASKTVDSVLHLFGAVQDDFRPFNFTSSVALNSTILDLPTLMQKVATCANSTKVDCVGAVALYRNIANATIEKTRAMASGPRGPTLEPVLTQLKSISTSLEQTIVSNDTTTLQATGHTFGILIGTTTGDMAKYGNISDSLLLMYDAFSEALRCTGVSTTLYLDKCAMYRDRLNGALSDFIQFLQGNIGALPTIGPLILTPLLNALNTLLADIQQGLATSISGVTAIMYGILQVVNIAVPANQANVMRDYLLRLVGLLNVPTECGGGGSPCSGLIKIVCMMADAVIALISAIPLVGAGIGAVLNPLLNTLLVALKSGASVAINASYGALSAALSGVEHLPYFGNIATPFRYLLDAVKKVVDCLAVGTAPSATTTAHI